MISDETSIFSVSRGNHERSAFQFANHEIRYLPRPNLPPKTYIYYPVNTAPNKNRLWTQSGLYSWHPFTGGTKLTLPNQQVSDLEKDMNENYWISTLYNGLFKCPRLACINLSEHAEQKNRQVRTLCSFSSTILAGSVKGELLELDTIGHVLNSFPSGTLDEIEFIKYHDSSGNIYFDGGLFD